MMDNDALLKELYAKVNEWFEEKPQRQIAQFMLDTMLPIIDREVRRGLVEQKQYILELDRELQTGESHAKIQSTQNN